MGKNVEKTWFIASLIFYSGYLHADGASEIPPTPLVSPRYDGKYHIFLTGDFLYWTARENGLAFAIIDHQSEVNTPAKDARVKQVPTEWHAGYKLGAGWNSPYDGWDLYGRWTHFNQNPTSHIHAEKDKHLFAPWLDPTLETNRPKVAKAKWKLHFNSYDLEIGRSYCFSNFITLRPHLGLEGATIRQDLEIVYRDSPAGKSPTTKSHRAGFGKADVRLKNHFWGVGLCGGLDSLWKFTDNWALFANASVGILWGEFETAVKEDHFRVTNGTEKESIVDDHDDHHTAKANLQYSAGISWDQYFSRNRYHLAITAGWEQQLWFGQNQIFHFDSFHLVGHGHIENSNLSLSGLTVGTRLDF